MVDIRLARLGDGPELARLRWQYAHEGHASVLPLKEFQADFLTFLAAALESGRWGIWVADAEDRIVGTLSVQLIDRAPRPVPSNRWKAYITGAYVEPSLRNGGIGRALLDAAVVWAREHGAGSCIVWPTPRSEPFYRRAGFDATAALELPADPH
jgi:GNAT superfamily N-acetyltransferase